MITDKMREVYEKIKRDEDIPQDKQILVDWLNDKVDTLNFMRQILEQSPEAISMGALEDGEYEVEVDACSWSATDFNFDECFIHHGLRALAEAVGEEVTHRLQGGTPETYREIICFEFTYRGIKFFQLEYARLDGKRG